MIKKTSEQNRIFITDNAAHAIPSVLTFPLSLLNFNRIHLFCTNVFLFNHLERNKRVRCVILMRIHSHMRCRILKLRRECNEFRFGSGVAALACICLLGALAKWQIHKASTHAKLISKRIKHFKHFLSLFLFFILYHCENSNCFPFWFSLFRFRWAAAFSFTQTHTRIYTFSLYSLLCVWALITLRIYVNCARRKDASISDGIGKWRNFIQVKKFYLF